MSEPEGLGKEGRGNEGLSDEGLSRRFDPRFSPAFQPGYDPRVHREAPPSAPLREEPRRDWSEPALDRTPPRRDWPESRREAAEATTGAAPDGLSIFAIPEDAAGEPAAMAFEDVEPVPRWRRINPWFFVLWALGLAFVLAGAAVMSFVVEWVNSPQQQAGFGFASSVLMQSTLWGAPMLIVLGLATITSTIVILAARWHRP